MYIENTLGSNLLEEPKSLSKLTECIDIKLGLKPGGSLFCIKYLIAHKYWIIDMRKPINTDAIFTVKEFKSLIFDNEEVI